MGNATTAAQELRNATCHTFQPRFMQLLAYSACLREFGAHHQWMGERGLVMLRTMTINLRTVAGILTAQPQLTHPPTHPIQTAFIDTDEFLIPANSEEDLPILLREYESYGGLAVNWRMFGSGGQGGTAVGPMQVRVLCFLPPQACLTRHVLTNGPACCACRRPQEATEQHAAGVHQVLRKTGECLANGGACSPAGVVYSCMAHCLVSTCPSDAGCSCMARCLVSTPI